MNSQILRVGQTYSFMGYNWTACELINNDKTAVIQSHGVTHGEWPGCKMKKFGIIDYYVSSIDGQNISAYDDKMRSLYDAIKDTEDASVSYGKGLYLISKEKAGFKEFCEPGSGNYWQALKETAANSSLFGASYHNAWLGTVHDSGCAWFVNSGGNFYCCISQHVDFVVAPAFNLDLAKVEIVGNEIIKKENINRRKNKWYRKKF